MVKYGDWELRIHEIKGKIDRGELIPDPDWQRDYIWKLKDEQLLIDSIIRGVPIPKFYLTEEYNPEKGAAVHMVVDGQQRLKAVHRFLDNQFYIKIEGRKYFFKDLDLATQEKITTYKLNGHYLGNFTQADINFLFQRLNRTGIKLTNIEEWNNEFTGTKILAMVKEIEQEHKPFYEDIIYTEGNIVRKLPLDDIIDLCNCLNRNSVVAGRKNDLVSFLKNNKDISRNQSANLKSKFRKVINNIHEIFSKQDIEDSLYRKRTHFISLFLSVGLLIVDYYIISNTTQLKKDLLDFIQDPPDEYRESVLGAIRAKVKREQRVKMLQEVILNHSIKLDPERNFPASLRRKLYRREPVCQICHKKITKLRSATVDHKVPWSKGGKTEEKNAQLAHINCNQRKKDSLDLEKFVITKVL
jgi:hypothetical protein